MTTEMFSFGQYGPYIWSAYGLSALVLIVNVIAAVRRQRNIKRELRAWLGARGEVEQ